MVCGGSFGARAGARLGLEEQVTALAADGTAAAAQAAAAQACDARA